MWSEAGTFKFHMSNNNIRHTSFQHIISTPDPKPKIKTDHGLKLIEQEEEEQSQKDEEEEEDGQLEDEQLVDEHLEDEHLEEEQQEKENINTDQENSENCAHPEKVVKSSRQIFSYCVNVEGQDRTEDSFDCCCNWCYTYIGRGLWYVCMTHKGSGWHDETPDCKKVFPDYIQHDTAGKILQYPPVN